MQPNAFGTPQADTVRVFVAATPAEWLPMKVLEFSICETTGLPVQLSAIYTHHRTIPTPKNSANRARTPFSFQRFLIPEICGFRGKAIYLDADMQVFQDIGLLWNQPFEGSALQTVGGAHAGRRSQFSVMLMDCQQLAWNIDDIISQLDSGSLSYEELMYEMKLAGKISYSIPAQWNSLESFSESDTCLLHYTDMNTQPWVSLDNKNEEQWVACLRRALAEGFISREDLQREIAMGHVRPSLLPQVLASSAARWKPGFADLLRDASYTPPFYSITASSRGRLRANLAKAFRAVRLLLRALLRPAASS